VRAGDFFNPILVDHLYRPHKQNSQKHLHSKASLPVRLAIHKTAVSTHLKERTSLSTFFTQKFNAHQLLFFSNNFNMLKTGTNHAKYSNHNWLTNY